jgi:hypothetical protein
MIKVAEKCRYIKRVSFLSQYKLTYADHF